MLISRKLGRRHNINWHDHCLAFCHSFRINVGMIHRATLIHRIIVGQIHLRRGQTQVLLNVSCHVLLMIRSLTPIFVDYMIISCNYCPLLLICFLTSISRYRIQVLVASFNAPLTSGRGRPSHVLLRSWALPRCPTSFLRGGN